LLYTDFTAIAGGGKHSLGLRSNGSIVAWGLNSVGQCDVPTSNEGFVAVAAGEFHSLALRDTVFRPQNFRPKVSLTTAPSPFDSVYYNVRFAWSSHDKDGSIHHHIYSIDPPVAADTLWIPTVDTTVTLMLQSTEPESPLPSDHPVASSDFHVFVLKAVDDQATASTAAWRAFKTFTVCPESRITSPVPDPAMPVDVDTAVVIVWEGSDSDGTATQVPEEYAVRLASLQQIQVALGLGGADPTAADIQDYFGTWVPEFGGWERVGSDASTKMLMGLPTGSRYYFAVVAFDEAAAYDPLFSLDRNVLHFRTRDATQVQANGSDRVRAERR
jgi:hypothetical protein